MRILVTGASGQLGPYVLQALERRPGTVAAWSGTRTGTVCGCVLTPVNLASVDAVQSAFRRCKPDGVLHVGALAAVADCYRDPQRAAEVNVRATGLLAQLAAEGHARFVFVSTDLVFNGAHGNYREQDRPAPLSIYARTKVEAEAAVLAHPGHAVVRTSILFGPSLTARGSFFDRQLAALRQGQPMSLFEDEWRTPLSLRTAAEALVAVTESDFSGLLHVGGPERLSRLEMGRRLARFLGLDPALFTAAQSEQSPATEPRPRDVSLDSSRWRRTFSELSWPTHAEALRELLLT